MKRYVIFNGQKILQENESFSGLCVCCLTSKNVSNNEGGIPLCKSHKNEDVHLAPYYEPHKSIHEIEVIKTEE